MDTGLASTFSRALEGALRDAGYDQVFEFDAPDGPDVSEFRKGESVVMVEQRWDGEEHRCVSVRSDDADCRELARRAAIRCVAELVTDLFGPLSRLARPELRTKAEAVIRELMPWLLEGGG